MEKLLRKNVTVATAAETYENVKLLAVTAESIQIMTRTGFVRWFGRAEVTVSQFGC